MTPNQARTLRTKLGWTQRQMAEYLRLDQSSVSLMERKDGAIKGPAVVLLEQLAAQAEGKAGAA